MIWRAVAVFMSFLTLGSQVALARQGEDRPNIVFILSDDHRWDALGAAGNTKIRTPVLDRLAAEGTYFRQASIYVSQCAPSRALLLTGLTPHQSGYYANHSVDPSLEWADRFSVPTVPDLLQKAGYETVFVGKWHITTEPWLTGFSDVRTWLPGGAARYADTPLARGNSRRGRMTKGFTNGLFAEDAVAFLSSPAAKAKPFLLWFATTVPHSPYQPNPDHIEHLYEGVNPGDLHPPGFPPQTRANFGLPWMSTPETFADYYRSVTYLDELVGRILDTLEKEGLARNTIVVFLGDNGFMAGSRGLIGKVVPYEESSRVPMIVRLPGKRKGAVSDAPVSSIDLPPTFLAMAGVVAPKAWPGRDFRPLLAGGPGPAGEVAFGEWTDPGSQFRHLAHRMVRSPKYKLIRWKSAKRADELYDLSADPHETRNLIQDAAMDETRKRLDAQLDQWMEKTRDPARRWSKSEAEVAAQEAEEADESDRRKSVSDKARIQLEPSVLDGLVGTYEFVSRDTITIGRLGNKLVIVGDMGASEDLAAVAQDQFVHPRLPIRFMFKRDETGRATQLIRRFWRTEQEMTLDQKARKVQAQK